MSYVNITRNPNNPKQFGLDTRESSATTSKNKPSGLEKFFSGNRVEIDTKKPNEILKKKIEKIASTDPSLADDPFLAYLNQLIS